MIRTGGGTFDPDDDRHAFFLAGDPKMVHRKYHLTAVNEAYTDGGVREGITDPLARGSKLLLDSGIFNLTNRHMELTGCSMDEALGLPPEQIDGFGQLFDRYCELVSLYEPQLWGYIELDQGGRDNKRRTRARLHDLGFNPIPVYHPLNDGWSYFDELAEGYDRICFGNVVQARPSVRVQLLHTMWERRRRHPHLWVHVLGLTASELVLSIPPDSCDSSTWAGGMRWGNADTESSYLNRGSVGRLPAGFLYNRDVTRHESTGWMEAAQMHGAAYGAMTDTWRQITADRAQLGYEPWPPPHEQEATPHVR